MNVETNHIENQTEIVAQNSELIMAANGLSLQDVVETNVSLTDIVRFPSKIKECDKCFGNHKAARTPVDIFS